MTSLLPIKRCWAMNFEGIERARPPGIHMWLLAQTSMRSGLRRAFAQRSRGVVFRSDGVELLEDLRPSIAHVFERLCFRGLNEAGMDKAKALSVFTPGKNPRDDSLQP